MIFFSPEVEARTLQLLIFHQVMSPGRTMSDALLTSNSPSLVIPKLRDDGTNWADYEPRARRAMGSKGLVAHLEGRAKQPVPYVQVNDVLMVSTNPDVPATEDQIEAREKKITEYEQKEYLAQHLILSSTSPRLSQKVLQMTTAKAMWDAVKLDATAKSSLHQVDILNKLQTMKCPSSSDSKTHLSEVKTHFEKMTQLREHLRVTNSPISDSTFVSIIISSMPEVYRPTIQTVETTMKVTGSQIPPDDLIAIFLQEAEHRVIETGHSKNAESAMAAASGGKKQSKKKGKGKGKTNLICDNCHKPGHSKEDCWGPGGDKEGQGPN